MHTVLIVTRLVCTALLLGLLTSLGLGAANVAAFNSRAAALEQVWAGDEASGMTHEQLAPARASLQALRNRKLAFLPFSIFSGAALSDPFGRSEALAARGQAEALAAAHRRAADDLAHLKDVGGPNYEGVQAHSAELMAARQLPEYLRLASAWESEAKSLSDARDQLAQAAGGLTDGLPKDIVDSAARLQSVISAASQAQLSTEPAARALNHAQAFLKLGYAKELEQHKDVASEAASAADTVQHRIDTRAQADDLLGQLTSLLGQAAKYGLAGSAVTNATQAVADARAAESSGDDGKMDAAADGLKQAVDALSPAVAMARQKAQQAALQSTTACIEGAPAQLIVIHLTTQELVAYDNGCPFLTTPVTTGRPALPTDRGTFHIFAKYPSYHMISPWPPGSPFWYHDAWVYNAMEFVSDGTFIHNAGWQPADTYGPGSQYGPYASHGCVHVPDGPLARLYAWAQIGTTVTVID